METRTYKVYINGVLWFESDHWPSAQKTYQNAVAIARWRKYKSIELFCIDGNMLASWKAEESN